MRIEGSERREKLYIIGCILATVMIFGTICGIDHDVISLEQGIWQLIWSYVLGLWCCNGVRLEETRAARRPRRW